MVYTLNDWENDKAFSAKAGQEVSKEVYYKMLEASEPLELPPTKAEQALESYGVAVHKGFLMGLPVGSNGIGETYLAFCKNDYGRGTADKKTRYFYLGLSNKAKQYHGTYYIIDCLNANVAGIYPSKDFRNDNEVLDYASDYEASVYKVIYKHGERVEFRELTHSYGGRW